MTRRRIIAAALILIGTIHISTGDHLWSSGTYEAARAIAPRWVWGVAFVATGTALAAKMVPQWLAAAILAGVLSLWSGLLLVPVLNGHAHSGTAWIWPLLTVALVVEWAREQ